MADEYIKKTDAYRIAVHGTDPDVAYKIQQLQPEKVIEVPDLHVEVKMRSRIDWEKLKGEPPSFLDELDRYLKDLKEQEEKRRLLTGAEKCDNVEVEENGEYK